SLRPLMDGSFLVATTEPSTRARNIGFYSQFAVAFACCAFKSEISNLQFRICRLPSAIRGFLFPIFLFPARLLSLRSDGEARLRSRARPLGTSTARSTAAHHAFGAGFLGSTASTSA